MKCVVVRGRMSGSGRPEPAESADREPERGSVPCRSGSVPALQVRERSLISTILYLLSLSLSDVYLHILCVLLPLMEQMEYPRPWVRRGRIKSPGRRESPTSRNAE